MFSKLQNLTFQCIFDVRCQGLHNKIDCDFFIDTGSEASVALDTEIAKEPGWYILGENQESIGPYALSELRGKFIRLTPGFIRSFLSPCFIVQLFKLTSLIDSPC